MKDIQMIEEFDGWDEWYKKNEIEIEYRWRHKDFHENQGVILTSEDGAKDHGIVKGDKIVRIKNFYKPAGISAKNSEQTIALELLRDKKIPLKIISGSAGSGKSLISIAHAIESLKNGTTKIMLVKSMTPVGREIGFLPGTMEEKVMPWLGHYLDCFLHCDIPPYQVEEMIKEGVLDVTPFTFIQGRSLSNVTVIIDEAQNLDMNILKQLITRAGEGTEIIILGDQSQVFEEHMPNQSIYELLEKGRESPLVGTIHLTKTLRSPLAEWAVLNL